MFIAHVYAKSKSGNVDHWGSVDYYFGCKSNTPISQAIHHACRYLSENDDVHSVFTKHDLLIARNELSNEEVLSLFADKEAN